MTVNSRKEARNKADIIFTTDYIRSERAGHDVYYSTANGVDRENGYRFLLNVGIDGIDVELRRADNRSLAGTLIKSNRKAVYYI